ncbi:MAG: type II toxin-antitoxin system YafQ family toxin [Enorma burkinafasonensis]|nr:type II toxin-antitoxin system YafQ family toxin [Enorma burkinafasonensis]
MSRLTADFSGAFKRDLKKKAKRRGWDLSELEKVIE